jgi:hypothetical protein
MRESDEKDGTDCPDAYETESDERKDFIITFKLKIIFLLLLLSIWSLLS